MKKLKLVTTPPVYIVPLGSIIITLSTKLAEQLKRRSQGRIHVLHRRGKLGLGTAYVEGFKWALAKGYRVASDEADFIGALGAMAGSRPDPRLRAKVLKDFSWDAVCRRLDRQLRALG